MADSLLQFVVLWHSGIAEPHFDLMFETFAGSELAAWRSSVWPIEKRVSITRMKDHRRAYLQFEGELTQRRGRVERVGGGLCEVVIGENSVWRIGLAGSGDVLEFRLIEGENWEAYRV